MCIQSNKRFLLAINSKNVKVGNLSQLYTSKNSCPKSCPFKNAGCYAKDFCTNIHWNRAILTLEELRAKVNKTQLTRIIRHNIAGDLALNSNSDFIDFPLLVELCDIFKGYKVYTYTHCKPELMHNQLCYEYALKHNFIINFSCETFEKVQYCKNNNLLCVLAVETMQGNETTINNIKYTKCPSDKVNTFCMNCSLKENSCYCENRDNVIVLENHGNGKKKNTFLINI